MARANTEQRSLSKTRRSKGASRKRVSKAPSPWFAICFKALSVLCVGAGIIFTIWYYQPLDRVEEYANKPIAEVSIESEFKYMQQALAQKLVGQYISATFLELDIRALRDGVEAHPWIDKVTVSRRWPDRLVVKLTEQQPIARWGESQFLNMRGDIIEDDQSVDLSHLPRLVGLDHKAKDVMQLFLVLSKLLQSYGFVPAEFELDSTLAWTLSLKLKSNEDASSTLLVKLGRADMVAKMQRLMKVMENGLVSDFDNIQGIDMRYRNGFAVTWLDNSAGAIALTKNYSDKKELDTSEPQSDVRRVGNGTI